MYITSVPPALSKCRDTEGINSVNDSMGDVGTGCMIPDDTINTLKELKIKNINRIMIGTLNMNSLSTKFEQLKLLIANYLF